MYIKDVFNGVAEQLILLAEAIEHSGERFLSKQVRSIVKEMIGESDGCLMGQVNHGSFSDAAALDGLILSCEKLADLFGDTKKLKSLSHFDDLDSMQKNGSDGINYYGDSFHNKARNIVKDLDWLSIVEYRLSHIIQAYYDYHLLSYLEEGVRKTEFITARDQNLINKSFLKGCISNVIDQLAFKCPGCGRYHLLEDCFVTKSRSRYFRLCHKCAIKYVLCWIGFCSGFFLCLLFGLLFTIYDNPLFVFLSVISPIVGLVSEIVLNSVNHTLDTGDYRDMKNVFLSPEDRDEKKLRRKRRQ